VSGFSAHLLPHDATGLAREDIFLPPVHRVDVTTDRQLLRRGDTDAAACGDRAAAAMKDGS
jgi:hypothetical protein